MPYIKLDRRNQLDNPDRWPDPQTSGELNYVISMLLLDYATRRLEGLSYQSINDGLGALEGAKLEFYRRVVVPYEERKRAENGDIY